MLPYGHHVLGPPSATLQVRTAREGAVASAGHDLIIEVTRWEATLDVAGPDIRLSLTADARSLEPRWGLNGQNSLTDQNRSDIRKSIETKILKGVPISFRSTHVIDSGSGIQVRGDLTIGAATRQITFDLRPSPSGRVDATAKLTQSDFGIKPYSAMLGALKVRDSLEVVCKAQLSADVPPPVRAPAPPPAPAPAFAPVFLRPPAPPGAGARTASRAPPSPACPGPCPGPVYVRLPTPPPPAPAPAAAAPAAAAPVPAPAPARRPRPHRRPRQRPRRRPCLACAAPAPAPAPTPAPAPAVAATRPPARAPEPEPAPPSRFRPFTFLRQ